MKVLLAIPSYKRPYEIEKRTVYWLKELVGIDWKVFVRSTEYLYYSQIIPDEHLVEIEVNSFRETINAIGDYARKNEYDLVHKIDDDMGFKRIGNSKKADCGMVYMQLYQECIEEFAKNDDIGCITVSKPMYHIMGKLRGFQRQNKAVYGNYMIKTKYLYMPEGIELFDDIFFTMKVLEDNMRTLTYCNAYEDAICLKNTGGLQSMNRNEASRRTIERMKEHFPQIQVGNYKGNEDLVDIDLKALGIK